jgi:3D (Asp-Asp-Asp) domain-containing protein
MKNLQRFCFLWVFLAIMTAEGREQDIFPTDGVGLSDEGVVITDVYATAYYCVYNSELEGALTINKTISNNVYTLKASFLFGGRGTAMQGAGKTAPDGDYIKYTGGGGCFVRIAGRNAGKNLEGQWVISPKALRSRYARLGITDFSGFGNLALLHPDKATYSVASSITGSSGRQLTPWFSIAADPELIPTGQTCTLIFKSSDTILYGNVSANFKTDDVGGAIKGKRIDIYLGEGQSAIDGWQRTGGNRYVDIYLDFTPQMLAYDIPAGSS